MMDKKTVALLGGSALVATGFVGVRMYIRSEVRRSLVEEYDFDRMLSKNPLYAAVAKGLNVPTSQELAESLVPIWSLTGPYKAIEDVLVNKRKSAYWPSNRRKSDAPAWVDTAVFNILRKMYEIENNKQLTG
jgi:hypothetical protein